MVVAYISSNLDKHGVPAFGKAILSELDNRGHDVLVYQPTGDPATDAYQLGQARATADRVFVDWAQPPLDTVLQQWGGTDIPIFVRVHRIEMYNTEFIQPLPWSVVHTVFFIAEHVQERFLERVGQAPQRVVNLGHVGVDVDFWTPGEGRKLAPPWKIVIAGNVVPKKRQYTAVQMLADLPEDFHLDLIGSPGGLPGYGNHEYGQNITDLVHELGLEGRMSSDKHLDPPDLRERLREAHFVLSASNEEGCATVVAEGMACGCVPLVNCWRGAASLYPPEWVWRTPKGLYRLCKNWARRSDASKTALSHAMAEYARRYDQAAIARQLVDTITGPVDAASVGAWYASDEQFNHMVEQYGNERQQSAAQAAIALLPEDREGVQVLEVGCSLGYLSHQVEAAGYKAIGVDVCQRALGWAGEHGGGLFMAADATTTLPDGPFDLVTLVDVLEHIPQHKTDAALVRALHALKPGGLLMVRVPHGAKDKQVVEVSIYPKLIRRVLVDHGASIERFDKCGDLYFEIVARKAG